MKKILLLVSCFVTTSTIALGQEKTLFVDVKNIKCVAETASKEFPLVTKSFNNKSDAFSHNMELAIENEFIQASVSLSLENANNKYTYDNKVGVNGLFSMRTKEVIISAVNVKFLDYCQLSSKCEVQGDLHVMTFQTGGSSINCTVPLVE